jgi:hypothetical protein
MLCTKLINHFETPNRNNSDLFLFILQKVEVGFNRVNAIIILPVLDIPLAKIHQKK